jgi:chitin biosynthesis protein CHS5
MHSTKISGLGVDTEYSFYLVLRTTGGVFTSNTLTVKTHTMTNLTGITVTPGVLPQPLLQSLTAAVERIGAKMTETIRIDTTHFVCTEGRGSAWEKASEMNIPVVRPEWIEGCEREGKLIGVRGYYLDANPKQRVVGSNPSIDQGSAQRGQQGVVGSGSGREREGLDPRQGLSMASPASQAAMAASQAELPSPDVGKKQEVDEDGGESDEGEVEGEPGPDVVESPALGREREGFSAREEEVDDEESEDDVPHDPEKPRVEDEESDEDEEVPSRSKGKGKAEGGGEMEDVAL